jgi:hypothetical protein
VGGAVGAVVVLVAAPSTGDPVAATGAVAPAAGTAPGAAGAAAAVGAAAVGAAVVLVGPAAGRLVVAVGGERAGSLRASQSAAAIPIPTARAPPLNHSHHGAGDAAGEEPGSL